MVLLALSQCFGCSIFILFYPKQPAVNSHTGRYRSLVSTCLSTWRPTLRLWTLGIEPSTFGPGVQHPVYCPVPRIINVLHTLKLNLLSGPSHIRCESVQLKQKEPGTDSTDSERGEHGSHTGLVAGGVIVVLLVMASIITAIILRKKRIGKCLKCVKLKRIMVTWN